MIDVQIYDTPIPLTDLLQKASGAACGALATFTGTVRNNTGGRKVSRLEYECYYPMAIKEMESIAREAMEQFDIQHISIRHRMGLLVVGDIAVNIAVGAAHRAAAFAACQFTIDTLKQRVPIWKKEVFEDGEAWTSAHA